jgi:outer membrane murein-binding lipoprotein Lpp
MRRLILAGMVSAAVAGCASNKSSNQPGTRIRDTTLTAKVDTTNPNDTLPHIRDSVPDSTRH